MSPAQREDLLTKYYLALRLLKHESELNSNLTVETDIPSSARIRLTIQKAKELSQINNLL